MPVPRWPKAHFSPAQVLVFGFTALILFGAALLTLPVATRDGAGLPFIDALFEATSATCVTGLVVVDTATTFTFFGQTVILLLIQFGGWGIMTLATIVFLFLGRRISLRGRLVMREALNQLTLEGIVRLTRYVIGVSLVIEGAGAVLLSLRFIPEFGLSQGVWASVFHAVSAFCNAGFDVIGGFRSLTPFVGDPLVVLTVAGLIIVGGIGFTVIADVYRHRRFSCLSLHSKLALSVTAGLLLAGTVLIYFFERGNEQTLRGLPLGPQVLASFFHSVTPRTAGFNTLNVGAMTDSSLILSIILMFIGASPSSTGGGIKTTTFGALALAVLAVVRGKDEVVAFSRRLPTMIIYRALAIAVISLGLVIVVTMALDASQPHLTFLPLLFETTSAFGTVGLSTGVTPSLTKLGKLLIIGTMFAGRVGPLTLAVALGQRATRASLRYPEDKVMVG
ncbi:MAG: TrkH family potassium uptake protein [Bacillota bacterium]